MEMQLEVPSPQFLLIEVSVIYTKKKKKKEFLKHCRILIFFFNIIYLAETASQVYKEDAFRNNPKR
jgi:hypothetical protein